MRRESLLRAVIESPEDDAPRLAFADWLESDGNTERAEFIRVQCSLAAMPADDPRRTELEHREQAFLEQFGWTWAEEFGLTISEWVYQRGFIERVETCLEVPAEQIKTLLTMAPIRHIRDISQFCDLEGVVQSLPEMRGLTGLEFWGLYAFDDELVRQMLTSPHLAGLRTLILHHDRNGNVVDDEVIIDGLRSPYRSRLEELAVNVDGCWRGPSLDVLATIAASPSLRNLKKLNLSNAGDVGNRPGLTVDAVHNLARSPNLQQLEELDLGQCSCEPAVVDALLNLAKLPRLKSVRLCAARLLNEEGYTAADLAELPEVRAAFEARVPHIDWMSEFVSPWDGNCWTGLSWKQQTVRLLFGMDGYIRRRDFDGLELRYRDLCRELDGESERNRISRIDFASYAASFDAAFDEILQKAKKHNAKSLVLRLRPDLNWRGGFHAQADIPASDEARDEFSYNSPVSKVPLGDFGEAGREFKGVSKGTRPNGVSLYLIARMAATIGRFLERRPSPLPFYFSCMYAIFRMNGR